MTQPMPSGPDLRALVREVLHELAPELQAAARQLAGSRPSHAATRVDLPAAPVRLRPAPVAAEQTPPDSTTIVGTAAGGAEMVRLASDRDLDVFVRHLLRLFENPKSRAELRAGKRRFSLACSASSATPASHRRIEKGAVTEAQVRDAAQAGAGLLLGRRAVLTPLARDKARALGVVIEKEKSC